MIESGVGTPSASQIAQLAALAIILKGGYSMDRALAPHHSSNSDPVDSNAQALLLSEFRQLNPEAQRGTIQYIQQMRKGYQKAGKGMIPGVSQ